MSFEETKKYLSQIAKLDAMIANRQEEIERLQTTATSITARIKDVNVQTSGDKDLVGSTVSRIVDLQREVDDLVKEYVNKRKTITKQIDSIEDLKIYHILTKKYVLHKTWGEIAEEMGYTDKTRRAMYFLFENALAYFENQYGNYYKSE